MSLSGLQIPSVLSETGDFWCKNTVKSWLLQRWDERDAVVGDPGGQAGEQPMGLGGCDSTEMGTLLFTGQVAQQGSPQGHLCWREVIYLLLSVALLSLVLLVSLVVTSVTGLTRVICGNWCHWWSLVFTGVPHFI